MLNFFFFIFLINKYINKNRIYLNKKNETPLNTNTFECQKTSISYKNCYISIFNIRVIHLIITRFLIDVYSHRFPKKNYTKEYISNAFRVLEKYLLPSLENQSCKDFTFILILGNKNNITYIKSLLNFNNSFNLKVIYQKDINNYVKNITKGFDVLITTRIDYEDIIYYDAVNDVRKAINIHKPILLYGYNRGIYYFELKRQYYDFYRNYRGQGCMSIFASLIIDLKLVNDTYIIYDLKSHVLIRKKIIEKYQSYGIKKLDYEPAIFDSGDPKFAWVRHQYNGGWVGKINETLKIKNFDLSKFYKK